MVSVTWHFFVCNFSTNYFPASDHLKKKTSRQSTFFRFELDLLIKGIVQYNWIWTQIPNWQRLSTGILEAVMTKDGENDFLSTVLLSLMTMGESRILILL